MKVDQVGRHFMSLYPMFSKLKQIIYWVMLELNIIVKIVVDIMDIFLKMDHNLQEKGTVTMVFV
jgi:hypothetical protein